MDAATAVALVSSGVAAIISVTVPWMTFRLALRQDQVRTLRDRRAELYVDLLGEAHAEMEYFNFTSEDDETRERMRSYYVDLRLPAAERARLAARANIHGSRTVNRLFNEVQRQALVASLPRGGPGTSSRMMARVHVAEAVERLQATIRQEMGTDQIAFVASPPTPRVGTDNHARNNVQQT